MGKLLIQMNLNICSGFIQKLIKVPFVLLFLFCFLFLLYLCYPYPAGCQESGAIRHSRSYIFSNSGEHTRCFQFSEKFFLSIDCLIAMQIGSVVHLW